MMGWDRIKLFWRACEYLLTRHDPSFSFIDSLNGNYGPGIMLSTDIFHKDYVVPKAKKLRNSASVYEPHRIHSIAGFIY